MVDLTSEFPERQGVRTGREYLCHPTLDATVHPDFDELIQRVSELPTPVYVHCAQGHGRSGTVVAAMLMFRGVASADEAIAAVRRARPGARLNGQQAAFLGRPSRAPS